MNQPTMTCKAVQFLPKGKDMGRDGQVFAQFVGYGTAAERFAQSISKSNKSLVQITALDDALNTYACWNKGERVW